MSIQEDGLLSIYKEIDGESTEEKLKEKRGCEKLVIRFPVSLKVNAKKKIVKIVI